MPVGSVKVNAVHDMNFSIRGRALLSAHQVPVNCFGAPV